jgi:hypothetical protein
VVNIGELYAAMVIHPLQNKTKGIKEEGSLELKNLWPLTRGILELNISMVLPFHFRH